MYAWLCACLLGLKTYGTVFKVRRVLDVVNVTVTTSIDQHTSLNRQTRSGDSPVLIG